MCSNNTLVLADNKCQHCDGEVMSAAKADGKARKRRFCSTQCGKSYAYIAKHGHEQPKRITTLGRKFNCKHCKQDYHTKRTGGEGETFCSRDCSYAYKTHKKLLRKENKAVVYKIHRCMCKICGDLFWSAHHRNTTCSSDVCNEKNISQKNALSSVTRVRNKEAINCMVCKCLFSQVYGWFKHTCSDICATEKAREAKSSYRRGRGNQTHRARARRYGCEYKPFNPIDIFIRDGWVCCGCGCDTPKHLRGTTSDDAPELDHIEPISLGGSHSTLNAQTLCRVCNILKSTHSMTDFLLSLRTPLGG